MTKQAYSLKRQLLIWLLGFLFIILSASAIISYYRAYHFANLAYDRAMLRVALALADQVDVVGTQVVIDLPQIAKDIVEYDAEDFVAYRISAPDGRLVIGDSALKLPSILPQTDKHLYYDDRLKSEPVRIVAYALPIINASISGNLLIQVAETRTKRQNMIKEIIEEMILPQLLIMLVTTLVIIYAIKRGLAPLESLRNALATRSPQDMSHLKTDNTPNEIKPFLNEINNLLSRIKSNTEYQKNFIANASHQLRTPVTILQNQIELAERENISETTKNYLKRITTTTHQLSRLIKQLLTLARVEPQAEHTHVTQPVNLIALAKEVTTEWVPLAVEKKIDLGFESDLHEVSLLGDAFMLREMLANIIDNAICYTPQDGEITVSVTCNSQQFLLKVTDSGIGIPPDQRHLIFDRFYRINDNVGEGCGLGLAIVKEIANAHHAEITIEDGFPQPQGKGSGTSITVIFGKQDNIPHVTK